MGGFGKGAGAGWVRFSLIALVLTLAAACTTIYRDHGYIPSDAELAKVALGETRDEVGQKIGRPTTQTLLSENAWYYVQSRWATRGAMAPREVDRQVVVISFDEAGKVSNVERFGLDRGRVVPLSRRVTASNIKGIGFLRQILGNIGRIGPSGVTGQ